MHPALLSVSHRPWPLPPEPWVMTQSWHDLLFAHWALPKARLRPLIPQELELDSFEGLCWVGVVPFWMSGVRARGIPALPGLSRFAELNVRTYVKFNHRPGVYFFSLDAANYAAVWAARALYHLPYHYADMQVESGAEEIEYTSKRVSGSAEFAGRYGPCGPIKPAQPGSIGHWLTERYCLYCVHRGRLYRGEVHHQPWPLQPAWAEIKVNTMALAAGITIPSEAPLLHFARRLDVLIWPVRRVI